MSAEKVEKMSAISSYVTRPAVALAFALGMGMMVLAVTPASATAITQGGGFTVSWDLAISGHPDETATAVFSNFDYISSTQLQFDLDVTNTTTNAGAGAYTGDRLVSFGWNTSPSTSATTSDSGVFASTDNAKITSTAVGVCFYAGNNCSGGGNRGLESSDLATVNNPYTTGAFLVTLTFDQSALPLDFSTFVAKFQTSGGSVEGLGTVGTTTTTNGDIPSVPEPASMAVLAFGVLGLAALRTRRAWH